MDSSLLGMKNSIIGGTVILFTYEGYEIRGWMCHELSVFRYYFGSRSGVLKLGYQEQWAFAHVMYTYIYDDLSDIVFAYHSGSMLSAVESINPGCSAIKKLFRRPPKGLDSTHSQKPRGNDEQSEFE